MMQPSKMPKPNGDELAKPKVYGATVEQENWIVGSYIGHCA